MVVRREQECVEAVPSAIGQASKLPSTFKRDILLNEVKLSQDPLADLSVGSDAFRAAVVKLLKDFDFESDGLEGRISAIRALLDRYGEKDGSPAERGFHREAFEGLIALHNLISKIQQPGVGYDLKKECSDVARKLYFDSGDYFCANLSNDKQSGLLYHPLLDKKVNVSGKQQNVGKVVLEALLEQMREEKSDPADIAEVQNRVPR